MKYNHVYYFLLLFVFANSFGLSHPQVSFYDGGVVTKKNEQEVRKILRKLNYQHSETIIVRKLNEQVKTCYACVLEVPFSQKHMFIWEEWFEGAPEDQKIFLIGHECMHLRMNHLSKRILFVFMTLCGFKGLAMKLSPSKLKQELISSFGILIVLPLFYLLSRFHEFQADYWSAKNLDCADGGIAWCKSMASTTHLGLAQSESWRDYLLKKVKSIFSTHPTIEKRIQALEALNLAK